MGPYTGLMHQLVLKSSPGSNETVLEGLMTARDVSTLFNRKLVTLELWKKQGMPYVRIKGDDRDTIRFVLQDLIKWAQDNRKRLHLD